MTNIRMNSKKIWLNQTFNMSRKYFFIVSILLLLAPRPIPWPLHIQSIRYFCWQYCLSFPSISLVNLQRDSDYCIKLNKWAPSSLKKAMPECFSTDAYCSIQQFRFVDCFVDRIGHLHTSSSLPLATIVCYAMCQRMFPTPPCRER